jgi:nucleotide-binding universal stress UspA family protein
MTGPSSPGPNAAAATTILAPLDGSEPARAALPYAMALGGPGTRIVLLTVLPAAEEVTGASGEVVVPADEMSGVEADQTRDGLEQEARRLRASGQDVQTEVAFGAPAARILDAARDLSAAMIVMSTHGRGAVGRLLFGSVADTVARESDVPVMIVRAAPLEPGPVGITRLVVPLDGSPLAEQALPVATAISRRLGTSLFLVRAVNLGDLTPPAIGLGEVIPVEVYEQTEEQLEQDARDYLDTVAKALRDQGLPVATRVLMGPPAEAIMEATQLGDVVVLCSHERTGFTRWLMGSVAEQLTREDRSPVILAPAAVTDRATH